MTSLRIVFAGSPLAAVPSLTRLAEESAHDVIAVVTREHSAQGRKRVLTPTPVFEEASRLGIPIITANRLDADVAERIRELRPDLGVIVAYGGLVREPLLSLPRLGWINLHFSLLPRWRGAAPVQHAVIAGDTVTGASVFQLVPELDAGAVYAEREHPIGAHETAGHLLDALSIVGAGLLWEVVEELSAGKAVARAQEGEPSLAPKLGLEDARIDWTRSAEEVYARVRGVTPVPGAFTTLGDERLKILEAAIAHDRRPLAAGRFAELGGSVLVGTASAPLELLRVHPAGRTPMKAADWWRGRVPGAAVVAG